MRSTDTSKCVPDEPAVTHHLGQRVQNLKNPIFTFGILSLNATNNSCRLHKTNCFCAFVCEHLSACLHNLFLWEVICCNHHHIKHEHDQLYLGPLLYLFLWEGCAITPILLLCSLADRIKYSETPKYSEQYLPDQESGVKVNIFNFSIFEAVTNFSFIAACSLSSSSALFLVISVI